MCRALKCKLLHMAPPWNTRAPVDLHHHMQQFRQSFDTKRWSADVRFVEDALFMSTSLQDHQPNIMQQRTLSSTHRYPHNRFAAWQSRSVASLPQHPSARSCTSTRRCVPTVPVNPSQGSPATAEHARVMQYSALLSSAAFSGALARTPRPRRNYRSAV